jgi:urate oxidase
MIELGPNRYGKSAIRLVKVTRLADRHDLRDLTVDVQLEGDFTAAHTEGDNSLVVATDTMKNTVYAFAKDHLDGSIESFGVALARHFLAFDQVANATLRIHQHSWARIRRDLGPAGDAFVRQRELTRVANVVGARPTEDEGGRLEIRAGIEDLVVMKTARSSFEGFPRDAYTTLRETTDRILATKLSATWRYRDPADGLDYDRIFDAVHVTLLEVFGEHDSRSVQESIWLLGRAVLERHAEIDEISLTAPNLHHWLVDLSPFGLSNENEIFVATTEPHGLIEATIRRSGG